MLKQRKWKAILIDAIFAILIYWATNLIDPEMTQHVLFLIGALQPAIVAYILGVAHEDAAAKSRIGASIEFATRVDDDDASGN